MRGVVLLTLALLGSCTLSVQSRQMLQAYAPAGGVPAQGPSSNCPTTVFQVAQQAGLTTFLAAARLDQLQSSLDNATVGSLTYTVLAPTNDAFNETLSALGLHDLQDVLFHGALDPILQYHFFTQPYTVEQLESIGSLPTNYQNQALTFSPDGTITGFHGSNATFVSGQTNLRACQSIVHVIDQVLVPDLTNAPRAPVPAPSAASS